MQAESCIWQVEDYSFKLDSTHLKKKKPSNFHKISPICIWNSDTSSAWALGAVSTNFQVLYMTKCILSLKKIKK